jgi:hypothetical protein
MYYCTEFGEDMMCKELIEPLGLAILAGNLSALFITFFIVFYSIYPGNAIVLAPMGVGHI